MLSAAAAVVTTSAWARRTLLELYALPGDRVHVAEPGVDAADLAPGTAGAGALLCVAAVIPGKGHDVLLDALATIDGPVLAVPVRGQPGPRPGVRGGAPPPRPERGLGDRVSFPGPRTGADLDAQLRRRRPARAGVARRDVRHGRHRGARPRPAGRRDRGRRGAGGPRSRRRRGAAGAARPARRPGRARRRAAGLAGRRRAARGAAPGRPRAARVALGVVDHRVRPRGVLAEAAR